MGVGGLNRFYVEKKKQKKKQKKKKEKKKKTRPRFCCGSKTYKLFGPSEGLLIHLCIKIANI